MVNIISIGNVLHACVSSWPVLKWKLKIEQRKYKQRRIRMLRLNWNEFIEPLLFELFFHSVCFFTNFSISVAGSLPRWQCTELVTHCFWIVPMYDARIFIFHFNNFTRSLLFGQFIQNRLLLFLLLLLLKTKPNKTAILVAIYFMPTNIYA